MGIDLRCAQASQSICCLRAIASKYAGERIACWTSELHGKDELWLETFTSGQVQLMATSKVIYSIGLHELLFTVTLFACWRGVVQLGIAWGES